VTKDRLEQKAGDNATQIGKVLGNVNIEHNVPSMLTIAILVATTAIVVIAIVFVLRFYFATNDDSSLISNLPNVTLSPLFHTPTRSASTNTPSHRSTITPVQDLTPTASIIVSTNIPTKPIIPTPSLPFSPAAQDEILVIIFPFDGSEDIHPEARIERKLKEELAILPSLSSVRVERYPEPIKEKNSEDVLAYIKETYGPSIIIWGWYDAIGINANYDIVNPKSFLFVKDYEPKLAEVLRLNSEPDKFTFYVAKDLPYETTYLTFFTIAQLYLSTREYDQAQIYLEQAIANLPEYLKGERENYGMCQAL
jgi:hypothetical protein